MAGNETWNYRQTSQFRLVGTQVVPVAILELSDYYLLSAIPFFE